MLVATILNHETGYGNAVLQGLMASIFSQFVYDKIHDNKNQEL